MSRRPVLMLTALAGADFSFSAGDTPMLRPEIAEAWIAAGIAGEPPAAAAAEGALAEARERILVLEGDLAETAGDRDILKEQAEELGRQLAAAVAERDALSAKVTALEAQLAAAKPAAKAKA